MNENGKTIVFVVVAVVAVAVALLSRPRPPRADDEDPRGKELFAEFQPLDAASLEITKYDDADSTVRPFKVAQAPSRSGQSRWSIPSHDNYPADAEDQLADVAADMVGLKVLDMASDSPGDHALYGVVAPDPKTLKAGSTGVGTEVTMRDKEDKVLMSLMIGKKVPDREELHYVRRSGQDPVYTVAVDTEKLSTRFQDWIEDDLLKLNPWDIEQIEIYDHSVDELNMALIQRGKTILDYNDTGDPKWKMEKDERFQDGKWTPVKLGADEELNTTKLDDMKSALDDLKIVDVARKPAGLSGNLRAAEDFVDNQEAVSSLASSGFYVAKVKDQVELYSNEGEIRCLMKDGVEYILRFGEIAGSGAANNDKKEETEDEKEEDGENEADDEASGLNRYIFVTAEFNQDAIPKPELEPLPEEKKAEESPKTEEKSEEKKDDAKAGEDKEPEKAEDGKDKESPEEKKADDSKAEADKNEEPKEEKPSAEELKKKREEIEKENKRKQAEYEEKIVAGKKRVEELNDRFADWYYIISDSVYRKIHLNRGEIIKKKEKKQEEADGTGDTPADFGELKEGLKE